MINEQQQDKKGLTNNGKPHVCFTIQAHKNSKESVYLCDKCDMAVDDPNISSSPESTEKKCVHCTVGKDNICVDCGTKYYEVPTPPLDSLDEEFERMFPVSIDYFQLAEIDEIHSHTTELFIKMENEARTKRAKAKNEALKSFLHSVHDRAYEEGKKQGLIEEREMHETIDDYCCACDYDRAVFESKVKEAYQAGVRETVEKIWEFAKFNKSLSMADFDSFCFRRFGIEVTKFNEKEV